VVLVDTSVWIAHFRRASDALQEMLVAGAVVCHPAVIGELACGTLKSRAATLDLLHELPRATDATDEEVLTFLEHHRLFGSGLGWTDVHLLAAAAVSGCEIWTLDRKLTDSARRLNLAHAGRM